MVEEREPVFVLKDTSKDTLIVAKQHKCRQAASSYGEL